VHQITYTNTGNDDITHSAPGTWLAGVNPGDYAIASNTCPQLLPAGVSCLIGVTFRPTATGARPAALVVTATAALGIVPTRAANLTGTGVQAGVAFSWPNGGTVGVWGTATGSRTITVTRTGAGSILTLTAVPDVANLSGGAQFSRTGGTCSATTVLMAGNLSCTVIVTRASPRVAGTATLTVNDTGAATASQVLNLSGT